MNLDFFAVRDDFRRLFEFIWQETDCRVAEGYSLYDQELRWFHFFDELTEAYPIGEDRSGSSDANWRYIDSHVAMVIRSDGRERAPHRHS